MMKDKKPTHLPLGTLWGRGPPGGTGRLRLSFPLSEYLFSPFLCRGKGKRSTEERGKEVFRRRAVPRGVRPLSSYKNERGTTGPHSIARWNGAGDTRVLGGVPTLVCPPPT